MGIAIRRPLVPYRRVGAVITALTVDRYNAYLMIDGTIVRAHQHAATGKGGAQNQALGRSRGGLTTKIHMLADALGRPLRLIITGGQVHDATQASALHEGQTADALIVDKAYDSDGLREKSAVMNAEAVIPSKRNRKLFIPHDQALYKDRNRIERCFNRLKHCRRFATRYDRRTIHFTGFIYLAVVMI